MSHEYDNSEEMSAIAVASQHNIARTCILGCRVNKLALCRFPIHDPKRCNNWLKFFDISEERVAELGGLTNLRVCLKHFNQKQQMAKTRIKTTPRRLQKEAIATTGVTGAATTNVMATIRSSETAVQSLVSSNGIGGGSDVIIAIRDAAPQDNRGQVLQGSNKNNNHNNNSNGMSNAIITKTTAAATGMSNGNKSITQRKISISSVTSLHSQTSAADTHSNSNSDTEQPTMQTNHNNSNGNSNKNGHHLNAANTLLNKLYASGKRKVYMITETTDQNSNADTAAGGNKPVKRKMYLIMEDTAAGAGGNADGDVNAAADTVAVQKTSTKAYVNNKTTNENKRKKLTLYTDKTDNELTQKFGKILPEILQHIQAQNGVSADTAKTNGNSDVVAATKPRSNKPVMPPQAAQNASKSELKPAITLPPKKNRTKMHEIDHEMFQMDDDDAAAAAAAAAAVSRPTCNNAVLLPLKRNNNNEANDTAAHPADKQINLSSDFLFLMKMLPKLEAITEPQKQKVKNYIESLINQSIGKQQEQQRYQY